MRWSTRGVTWFIWQTSWLSLIAMFSSQSLTENCLNYKRGMCLCIICTCSFLQFMPSFVSKPWIKQKHLYLPFNHCSCWWTMMFRRAAHLHTYICQDIVHSLSPTRKAGFSCVGAVCACEKIRLYCYIVNAKHGLNRLLHLLCKLVASSRVSNVSW